MKHFLVIVVLLVAGLLVFLEQRAKTVSPVMNSITSTTTPAIGDSGSVDTITTATTATTATAATSVAVVSTATSTTTHTQTTKKPTTTTPSAQPVYTRIPGVTGPLYVYNEAAYNHEVAQGKLVLLFYYAKWCPICAVETVEALYPAINAIDDPRFIAFRVNFNDFDTTAADRAIAKKFQIPYQHSKVFVYQGNVLLKDLEQWDRARYDIVFAQIFDQI